MDSGGCAVLRGLGLEDGHLCILEPRLSPQLRATGKGKKMEHSPPLTAASRKTSRTQLVGLKSAGGCFFFFFFLPSVSQWDLELWKDQRQIQKRDQKANTNNWNKIHFTILKNLHFILCLLNLFMLFYYCYCFFIILFFISFISV